MIVCVCHRVSDRDIEREVRHGCASFDELQDELRVATACGACTDCARETFDAACAARRAAAPVAVAHPVPAQPSLGARVFALVPVPVGVTPLAA